MSKDSKKDQIAANVSKLDELIAYFESEEETALDQDLKKYDEAMKLVHDVKKDLESFELKINEIKEKYSEEETEPEDLFDED